MPPKKTAPKPSSKKVSITIAEKKDIIRQYEEGKRITEIARELGKAFSTIATIIKKKEDIKAADASKGIKFLTSKKKRPEILNEVEKLLLIWINEKQLAGDSISEAIICEKAKALYADLLRQVAGSSKEEQVEFKASRGWFEKFRKRTGIHSVVRHREAVSSDAAAAAAEIKEMLQNWEKVRKILETHHPNKVNVGRSVNLVEENGINHFRNVLKLRQKQVKIDRFVVKLPKRVSSSDDSSVAKHPRVDSSDSSDPQPGPSGIQRPKQDIELPTVFLEDDEDEDVSSPPPS